MAASLDLESVLERIRFSRRQAWALRGSGRLEDAMTPAKFRTAFQSSSETKDDLLSATSDISPNPAPHVSMER